MLPWPLPMPRLYPFLFRDSIRRIKAIELLRNPNDNAIWLSPCLKILKAKQTSAMTANRIPMKYMMRFLLMPMPSVLTVSQH